MFEGYHLSTYIIMIAVVSFCGFLVENIWLAFTKGYIDNRNMNAPFLLGYGLLLVAFYLIFGTPKKMRLFGKACPVSRRLGQYALYFAAAFLVVSFCEVLLGSVVEWLCKVEVWNYTRLPLHITKYTSIPTSTGFAAIIFVAMNSVFTPLMNGLEGISASFAIPLSVVLLVILVGDFLVNAVRIYQTQSLYTLWRKDFNNSGILCYNGKKTTDD